MKKDRPKEPPRDEKLNSSAEGWLMNLPEDVRPTVVVEKYPRIVNRMAELWRRPDAFMDYVDGLLVDQRGGRAGFPMSVALELATIKDHYEMVVHPEMTKAYLWDPRQK